MNCNEARGKINGLLKGTIKGNDLRRTYYHLVKCPDCKEILLDEFSFYMTFNDLDNDLDFNYKKKFDEFLHKVEKRIITKDSDKRLKYTVISFAICFLFIILVTIAIRLVYK